jgi:hypothetical protein
MLIAAAQSTGPQPRAPERPISENVGDGGNSETGFYLTLTYFRETNAEGLRIRQRLTNAIELAKTASQADCIHEFQQAREIICDEIRKAASRATSIQQLRVIDPGIEAWYARELTKVEDAWDDLDQLWTPTGDTQELAAWIKQSQQSIEVIDALVFTCACQTIPDEVEQYLKNYRIGTSLDFIAVFKDQLPDEAATRDVLATLAPQSVLVSGLIDVKNAKIIKADRRPWRQMLSVAVVLVTVALGFGLIAIAANWTDWFKLGNTDWPVNSQQWRTLNAGYLLVLFGVLGHWILDRIKQNRAGTDVTPFSEWLMWIHVNEVPITMRIATVWVLIGLGIAFRTFNFSNTFQPVAFFTAGYFMDSTFDALIGRFNTFVANADPNKTSSSKS